MDTPEEKSATGTATDTAEKKSSAAPEQTPGATDDKSAAAATAKAGKPGKTAKTAKASKSGKPKPTASTTENAKAQTSGTGSADKSAATASAAAKFAGVDPAEVLDFKSLGEGRFIVVTTSGHKFTSTPDERKAQAAAAAAKAAQKAAAKAKAAQ